MLDIISHWSTRPASVENTFHLLEDVLNARLRPEYRRIWVQYSNSSSMNICFTIFPSNAEQSYSMRFHRVRNFRRFRHDQDLVSEIRLLEEFIASLPIQDIITTQN